MMPSTEKRSLPVIPIFILVAVVTFAGIGIWYLEKHSGDAGQELELTQEAKAYTRNLKLDGVQMKATENALGQTLVEIEGNIINNGDRPLRIVELNCIFYEPYGEVVLRERVAIVRIREGLLEPGETRIFRLPFDAIPDNWNQIMPRLIIAHITFG